MPSQSNELSSVEDFDLLTIEARLTELERRKSLLTAELLSYRSTLPISTILSQAKVIPSYEDPTPVTSTVGPRTETSNGSAASDGKAEATDEDILSDVIAHMRYSQKERLKKLYRMTGVTTFTSQDPSPPHKVNVGIRFELFGNREPPPLFLPSSLPLYPSSLVPLWAKLNLRRKIYKPPIHNSIPNLNLLHNPPTHNSSVPACPQPPGSVSSRRGEVCSCAPRQTSIIRTTSRCCGET